MKKVIRNEELKKYMIDAIEMLCEPVKNTLGPNGCNAIIDHSDFAPYVTNDGVTIAKNIESDDEIINTILELAKESTIKTDENVGDGTSTTLVLLESIYKECTKLIEKGISPIIIQRKIEEISKVIVSLIEEKSKKPKKEQLLSIAITSSNDEEIGKIVYKAFMKVKDKNFITLKEGKYTKINYINGYLIDTLLASPYFLENKELEFENSFILLSDSVMNDIDTISDILNFIHINKRNLIILSLDYDDYFVNQILSLVINDNYNIILLKIPEYGNRQLNILKDIESITNSKICHNTYLIDNLGCVNNIKIDSNRVIISFSSNNLVRNRIKLLNQNLKKEKEQYEIDFIKKRISMLKNRSVEIIVGGNNNTIIKEKMMRYIDAISSISSAYNGVVKGGGILLYEISMLLKTEEFNNIFKIALKEPLKCILNNSGIDNKIIEEIEKKNYSEIFNVKTLKFENEEETLVLDSKEVVINSIINSTSVVGMLITTSNLIINEFKDKEINYNNL